MKFDFENPFRKKESPWGRFNSEPYYRGGLRRIEYRRSKKIINLIENCRTLEEIKDGIRSVIEDYRERPTPNLLKDKDKVRTIESEMINRLNPNEKGAKAKEKFQNYISFDLNNIPEVRARTELLDAVSYIDNPRFNKIKSLWLQAIEELLPKEKWDYHRVLNGNAEIEDLSEGIQELVRSLLTYKDNKEKK